MRKGTSRYNGSDVKCLVSISLFEVCFFVFAALGLHWCAWALSCCGALALGTPALGGVVRGLVALGHVDPPRPGMEPCPWHCTVNS